MLLRVYPGERFPVNGTLTHGQTNLDRSHVTGESKPATVASGERIEAGTLNLSSSVDFTATSNAENSFLGEMKRMIAEAENG